MKQKRSSNFKIWLFIVIEGQEPNRPLISYLAMPILEKYGLEMCKMGNNFVFFNDCFKFAPILAILQLLCTHDSMIIEY